MLDRTRSLRLVLVAVSGLAAGLFPIIGPLHVAPAHADDDDDDDDADSDDGDDSGGDEGEEGDDEEEVDEDQPPITAGGLYTLKTYPQGEIQRPLTITKGLTEVKGGFGFDISNKTAFESVGASADLRYGVQDNVELRAGFEGLNNFKQWKAQAAFEGSIVYDLVDFRAGFTLAKTKATIASDGSVVEGKVKASIPIGFPFRYAPKEQVAVTALETAFSIDFDGKPDVTPNVGIVIQPQPLIAIILHASLEIPDFDFTADKIVVPASAAIQLTPSNRLDAGMEFRFGNLKLPAGQDLDGDGKDDKFYDDRFLLFFARYRL